MKLVIVCNNSSKFNSCSQQDQHEGVHQEASNIINEIKPVQIYTFLRRYILCTEISLDLLDLFWYGVDMVSL